VSALPDESFDFLGYTLSFSLEIVPRIMVMASSAVPRPTGVLATSSTAAAFAVPNWLYVQAVVANDRFVTESGHLAPGARPLHWEYLALTQNKCPEGRRPV
jgi:hypothetical protein